MPAISATRNSAPVLHVSRLCGPAVVLYLLIGLSAHPATAAAPRQTITGRILLISKKDVLVHFDEPPPFKKGDVGVIRFGTKAVGKVRVEDVKRNLMLGTVVRQYGVRGIKKDDKVVFAAASAAKAKAAPETPAPESPSATARPPTESTPEGFVPLLQPVTVKAKPAASRARNLFHGRIRTREIFQSIEPNGDRDWMTRVDSDGSIDRMFARPWSLTWSGNVRYRDGNSPSTAEDFRHARGYLYRLTAAGSLGDRTSMSLGRFIPIELPGLGYVDGLRLSHTPTPGFQLGVVGGARPDRVNLEFSKDESVASAYASLEAGRPGGVHYAGILGYMESFYFGKPDEAAVLYDQRSGLGRWINMSLTSQVGFDVGAARVRKGPRLTRLDVYLSSRPLRFLSLRAGANHFERPDTAAERSLSGEDNLDSIRNSGTWRYSGGSQQTLPFNCSLDEDIVYYRSNEGMSDGLWRVTLSRLGLLALTQARMSLAVFNLSPFEGDGHGGLLTASLPFRDNRVLVDLAYGFRYRSVNEQPKEFQTSDASARLLWRVDRHWTLDAGASRVFQEGVRSTLADVGVGYRW